MGARITALACSKKHRLALLGSEMGHTHYSVSFPMTWVVDSRCLTNPYDKSARSKISFGANALLSSDGSIFTPLVQSVSVPEDYYHVTLEEISVNNRGFPFMIGSHEKGNIMFDSGSLPSFLPEDMYQQLEILLINEVQDTPIPPRPSTYVKLCYKYRMNFKFPTIVFHFSEGADLALPMRNSMLDYGNLMCLTIVPTSGSVNLIGSVLQLQTMIGYDLVRKRISFSPNYC
ncbi:aspartic proteinase CDR1-like [Impatiens glandulifera]|uniref:aspartic proteinase CDR1-like n=1 Tax=Impatiens glandulifera TaxID=253017 RepID=UPI001FB0AA18|nr:aspartic proteinase CDR1-like [Impatiens glandulifera]